MTLPNQKGSDLGQLLYEAGVQHDSSEDVKTGDIVTTFPNEEEYLEASRIWQIDQTEAWIYYPKDQDPRFSRLRERQADKKVRARK